MKFIKSVLFLSLCCSLSCSKKQTLIPKAKVTRKEGKGLSEDVATQRKASLSNLTYLFEIDLRTANKSDSFSGESSIIFDFDKSNFSSDALTLDFEGGEVLKSFVNGVKVDAEYKGSFLTFDAKLFKDGKNTIKVSFNKNYSKTGSGLYKFTDTTDGGTYVYTDFEPYDANQFAPMFDQPNLKATYSLNVQAPADWTVISSVREQMVSDKKTHKLWSFPKSKKFSTYIFSLHGGPYRSWTDKVKLKSKEIELRLFARKSLAKFVKEDFWFKITKQGFNFFEQYFSTDYPYSKYDQVLVPDFNSGAMENVAAVTFNEAYVSREGKAPRAQRRRLANVIFHEMAHMWFGNLVTMNWWNDLWLNESFATFMANTGLFYNTEYTEVWTTFNGRTKQWAYGADMWRTTHPIEADIPSTSEATANFDGITYGKGASTLKQLVFLIGEDNFKKGLADYFATYAEKNTLRKNFIDSLQAHTKEDLNEWTKDWLQTKGLNSLSSEIKCQNSKLKSIAFTQGVVSGENKFRTHKLKLALWLTSNPKSPNAIEEVRISGKKTNWTPQKEMPCPLAVFPNWEDHAFIQVQLDEQSQEYFGRNIDQVDSDLMKAQFWSITRTMLSLGKFAPEKAMPLIKTHLPKEKNADSINTILRLSAPYRPVFYYYADQKRALAEQTELSDLLEKLIVKSKDLDSKKALFENWLYHSYEIKPKELTACLEKNCSFNLGFELDLDRKWLTAQYLAAAKSPKAQELINKLAKKDPSRRAELYQAQAEASLSKNKVGLLKKALNPNEALSLKKRNAIINGLLPIAQISDDFSFVEKSFHSYADRLSKLPRRVQTTFASRFAPLFCGDHQVSKPALTENLIQNSSWNFSVKKTLLQALDIEERCLKIKKLSKDKV